MVDNSRAASPTTGLDASLQQARDILHQMPTYRVRKCPLAVLSDATDTVVQCREAGNPKAIRRAEHEYLAALAAAHMHVYRMQASTDATRSAIKHHQRRQRQSLPWYRQFFEWLGS